MYYSKFRIQNFKGIKDTTINFENQGSASVFAFVGLNESGKTTILEAIHSFSPDSATSELVGGEEGSGVPFKDRVPRHLLSNFSGDVSVTATVCINESDKEMILAALWRDHGIKIEDDLLPAEIVLEKKQTFRGGDFQSSCFFLHHEFEAKSGKKRSFKSTDYGEQQNIRDTIYNHTPDIAYFPSFVFDFPERIFLTEERGDIVSQFYRRVFQDILDYDGKGHTIEDSIVRRIRTQNRIVPWLNFFHDWNTHDDKSKIRHVMDCAGAVVSNVVFGRWNQIFGEDATGKEINISYEAVEGERTDENGAITKSEEHDLYIQFEIKDGTRRFKVNDRSLGFRWFFAFMLFTQFRVARQVARPILFLFDEPASNLHAAAQQKLIECFPEIARGEHALAYSTHSHYMIEPKWLEQTFIVTNRADAPSSSVMETLSLDDETLDIQAKSYKSFVNKNPSKTSYFQPVLDRLEVVPSKFDLDRSSIILEGKSDYYILRYSARLLKFSDLPLVLGIGAGTFGALVALHIGWGIQTLFVLDGDKKEKEERERYVTEYGLSTNNCITLPDVLPDVSVIEDLLDNEALSIVSAELELKGKPTKKQILRFFQERLASDVLVNLGDGFEKKSKKLLDGLNTRLSNIN